MHFYSDVPTLEGIEALQSRQLGAFEKMQAITDAADTAGRDLTKEERDAYDDLDRLFRDLGGDIERRQQQREHALALAARTTPRPGQPGAGRNSSSPVTSMTPTATGAAAVPTFYARTFGTRRPEPTEFKSFANFASAIAKGLSHKEFFASGSGMGSDVGEDGGFLVPERFRGELLNEIAKRSVFLQRARVIKLDGGATAFPVFQDETRTSGGFAGLRGQWLGEGAPYTAQKAKVASLNLVAKKLGILVPVTWELLQDSLPNTEQRLFEGMAEAGARDLDYAFLSGTGAGQPLGILNAAATIAVAKESGQAAATITYTNVRSMISRLAPEAFSSAVWLVHPSAISELLGLQVVIKDAGTAVGGERVPVLSETGSGQMSLLTRPIVISEACSVLGAAGDIILADAKEYLVGLREDITLVRDTSVGFNTDEIYLKLRLRADGTPIASAPQAPRGTGAATVSPFITLAART